VFAPLRVQGTAESIVRRLGEAIGNGLLRPGERLPPEQQLAEMLEVAPMTLRQALAVLRDAGYVETRRGRGAGSFVAHDVLEPLRAAGRAPDRAALRDLVDWRRAVSGEAAALAAERAETAQRRAIVAAAEAAAAAAALGPFSGYRLADSAFHIAIAEASGSSRLVAGETALQAELGEVLASLPGSSSVEAVTSSNRGHGPILGAIETRDGEAARDATIRHVEATYDWIVGLRLGRFRDGDRRLEI
jgi:DNA-binding FadR family transcriptional regulator